MAAAEESYNELRPGSFVTDPPAAYCGDFGINNTAALEGNFSASIGRESPASFISAVQELGQRLLANSEEIEGGWPRNFRHKSSNSTRKYGGLIMWQRAAQGLEDNWK